MSLNAEQPPGRNVRSRPYSRTGRRRRGEGLYAALDLGTNNCRLLVARQDGDGFRIVDAFSRVVRLGEGLEESGILSDAAMQRTIEALRVCGAKIRRWDVERGRYVATAACRQAANCEEFLDRVEADTGIRIETIPAAEEARLTLAGCVPLLDTALPHALVFDIGGGSTEIIWLRVEETGARMIDWTSLPFGVVSLSERHGLGPFDADAYEAIVGELAALLAPFCERHDIAGQIGRTGVQMLGSSGTVTTLAGLSMNLPRYERSRVDGSYLDFATVSGLTAHLRAMSPNQRAAHSCIGRERADLMAAGCAILDAICRRWPAGRLRVADRGLREGILAELFGRGTIVAAADNDRR